MDELVNFYLNIKSKLNEKRTIKLVMERLQPYEYVIFLNNGESLKQKNSLKKLKKPELRLKKAILKVLETL